MFDELTMGQPTKMSEIYPMEDIVSFMQVEEFDLGIDDLDIELNMEYSAPDGYEYTLYDMIKEFDDLEIAENISNGIYEDVIEMLVAITSTVDIYFSQTIELSVNPNSSIEALQIIAKNIISKDILDNEPLEE